MLELALPGLRKSEHMSKWSALGMRAFGSSRPVESVSELRADATPLSPTTLSPSDSMPASPVDTPLRSQSTRRPGHLSLIRTVSCPILHYTHPHKRTSRSRSPPPAVPPLPTISATPTSPVAPESPHTKTRKVSLKKEKEVTPRLRTQPYAAPYFILGSWIIQERDRT
ncbi:hypothetical protein C8F04DRAFT_1286778 [Mycena alexandri]|uniref:Uncharacterized protein n=1 Tax=Mycena alexandri TaxID=1745969 RepID=A0AAD6TK81_9AGAR|nr:hypothetical protein C8F04DRAFT_1286778 [Mycena alexandri]